MSTDTRTIRERLTGGTIRERAVAAYRAQQEKNEREAVERTDREHAQAIERLERRVAEVFGPGPLLTGVVVLRDADDEYWEADGLVEGMPVQCGTYGLRARFLCRSCGLTTVYTPDVSDLEQLGRFLAAYDAGDRYATTCAGCWRAERQAAPAVTETAAPEPTIEQQLLSVLTRFIALTRAGGEA